MEEKIKKDMRTSLDNAAQIISAVASDIEQLMQEFPDDEEDRTKKQQEEYEALDIVKEELENSQSDIEGIELP